MKRQEDLRNRLDALNVVSVASFLLKEICHIKIGSKEPSKCDI